MAIARDSVTSGTAASGNPTLTFSHTCNGSNRILFVGAAGGNTGVAIDDITGATYAGVSMTLISKTFVLADRYRYLFYLVAPATGANNVVISSSTSGFIAGNSLSYTGANQSGQPDSFAVNQATAASLTVITSVVASNCWMVMVAGVGGASPAASTGSTLVGTQQNVTWFDTNGIVGTGSQSMSIVTNDASSHPIMGVMASFSPTASTAVNSGFFFAAFK